MLIWKTLTLNVTPPTLNPNGNRGQIRSDVGVRRHLTQHRWSAPKRGRVADAHDGSWSNFPGAGVRGGQMSGHLRCSLFARLDEWRYLKYSNDDSPCGLAWPGRADPHWHCVSYFGVDSTLSSTFFFIDGRRQRAGGIVVLIECSRRQYRLPWHRSRESY